MSVIGRFAPSPTGELHQGSLLTAVASYLAAKTIGGQWLLRIEDVDEPRCSPKYAHAILQTLENLGFEWDGAVVYQSQRRPLYEEAFQALFDKGRVYPCTCSRKAVATSGRLGVDGIIYNGHCANHQRDASKALLAKSNLAWRFQLSDEVFSYVDGLLGKQSSLVAQEFGDFVVLRSDGFFAYQLAVVVDDLAQGVNQIVRGSDLLHSTPRQLALYQALNASPPHYLHLPLIVNAAGEKLSKQTKAQAVASTNQAGIQALKLALHQLGQNPPADINQLPELWRWAFEHWNTKLICTSSIIMSA